MIFSPLGLPYFEVTSDNPIDANTCIEGVYQSRCSITNAPITNHGVLIYCAHLGTPFQLYMPDNQLRVFKRWIDSSGNWTAWTSTIYGDILTATGKIWIQGGSEAGGNANRLTTSSGMPGNMQYNQSRRGTQIYSNGIAFADPKNGNSNNDAGWIRHLEDTANQGNLEIGVGDDGNEGICVRQYNTSNAVVRTGWLLNSSGNTTFPGSCTATSHPTSSDRRLKEHISYLGKEAVRFVKSLLPAKFKMNGDTKLGFYAQDVEVDEIYHASMVAYSEDDGMRSLDYNQLIAPLVAAVQDLTQRVEELEERIGE